MYNSTLGLRVTKRKRKGLFWAARSGFLHTKWFRFFSTNVFFFFFTLNSIVEWYTKSMSLHRPPSLSSLVIFPMHSWPVDPVFVGVWTWGPWAESHSFEQLWYILGLNWTTHLDHVSHCKTASGTHWSNRWTCGVFLTNTHRDSIRCTKSARRFATKVLSRSGPSERPFWEQSYFAERTY